MGAAVWEPLRDLHELLNALESLKVIQGLSKTHRVYKAHEALAGRPQFGQNYGYLCYFRGTSCKLQFYFASGYSEVEL